MIKINLKTREQEILEVDVMCFLCEMLESKNGLAIISYPNGREPRRIDVQKNFDFIVENNRIEIYTKDQEESIFELGRLTEYEFWDWDEYIKFYSLIDNTVIKIASIDSITEEEDLLCIQ
ncbi:MAG: hypothetical protein VB130_00740 [Clostridium sp.]|nr:hypothetical protein [Clostridium sp.]